MPSALPSPLAAFLPETRSWFESAFVEPTPVQTRGWEAIAGGKHALLIAPTGSGKTLAAFLFAIDRLHREASEERHQTGVRVLYISPLKALAADVQRNLRTPLHGIAMRRAERAPGPNSERDSQSDVCSSIQIGMRSGDTTQKQRRDQVRNPPDILVTTPESLYLLLTSKARETLRTVHTVIVDEVHALAPTKRGAHLALSLERLALIADDPQRIGLSATAKPLEVVASFLGGTRETEVVDTSMKPHLDLEVVVPMTDLSRPPIVTPPATKPPSPAPSSSEQLLQREPQDDEFAKLAPIDAYGAEPVGIGPEAMYGHSRPIAPARGVWPPIIERVVKLIRAHRTTIIFVNSRGLCERLVQHIEQWAGEPLALAHHGSVSQERRREVEQRLKLGEVRAIVATSSLELGIDMGAVDLVIQVSSPKSVASGLQRAGRAGHQVGSQSVARIFPKTRTDLLECTAVARKMREGDLEGLKLPKNPLDVLAQHIVAMAAMDRWPVADLAALVRRAANFQSLPDDALDGVLNMLSGHYPSHAFADLRARIVYDRETNEIWGRKGSQSVAVINGGTIADRGMYRVHIAPNGARVGELDEEMIHETVPGDRITLGASTWKVEQITRDRVYVTPAPGDLGRLPFWRGNQVGRSVELGRAIGALLRRMEDDDANAATWLSSEHGIDDHSVDNLIALVREQQETTGCLPTDRAITIERTTDDLGAVRVCILSCWGRRVHAPWGLALQAKLAEEANMMANVVWTDDGICLQFANPDAAPSMEALVPEASEVRRLVVEHLGDSALFASHFRENAARALLLPRRRPGSRSPLWQQRLRSQQLLAVAKEYPSFPILVETYRQCLSDVFDVPALEEVLQGIEERRIRVDEVTTLAPSPFAKALAFEYVAANLYEGDAPLAERRTRALSLDRDLLFQLLGDSALRDLLDPAVAAELEAELQRLNQDRQARHADQLHDLFRWLGDLTAAEVVARCKGPGEDWLEQLVREKRVVALIIGGEARYGAVEDVALFRDACATAVPPGVAAVFLAPVQGALDALVIRYAKTHGPFAVQHLVARYPLSEGALTQTLRRLATTGTPPELVEGDFVPTQHQNQAQNQPQHQPQSQWCHRKVLSRIKRQTLAKLRGEVQAVEPDTLARFNLSYAGITDPKRGRPALEAALIRLEGIPLPFEALEDWILPARVVGFQPRMLDELGAEGFITWVGKGTLRGRTGKVALYRRSHRHLYLRAAVEPEGLSETARLIHEVLGELNSCFFDDLYRNVSRRDGSVDQATALEALWELVWSGLCTNDTFHPLRQAPPSRSTSARTSRRRRPTSLPLPRASGRWSRLVPDAGLSDTERSHAFATGLLERHGIVTTKTLELEDGSDGGFRAIYDVFRTMEDVGQVRRGYFVAELGGAQFAYAPAIDRLRRHRQPATDPPCVVLAATDPANPYGNILAWPSGHAHGLKRAATTLVVLREHELVCAFEPGPGRLHVFSDDAKRVEQGLTLLCTRLSKVAKRAVRLNSVNGQPVRQSPYCDILRASGAHEDPRGLTLDRRV